MDTVITSAEGKVMLFRSKADIIPPTPNVQSTDNETLQSFRHSLQVRC
jgi:hypothetical protein